MELQVRVMGARNFADTVEGKAYDFTKLRLEMKVPASKLNEIGCAEVEVSYGDATRFAELKRMKFPCLCVVDLELTSKGYDVVGDIRPVQAPK